ncbi:MAG: hypothetical protein G01um101456_256 [Parcubacteria group bacterium Gr01-1014_56]|nr:MAG: hypothetical protein G01um101456_256 [Parcubacteria group bacterium Gr01-1014_56]
MDTKTSFKDSSVRLIALLGLLLVLLLGAWGIILLAFNLPSIAQSVGGSIVSLFKYSPAPAASEPTTSNPAATTQPTTPAPKPTSGGSYTPTATYVPANSTANLYGYADLAVRILSINSLSSSQGRVALQFEITNIGSNVAPAGWMFTANLPVGYAYTYSSPAQQALYPGDKIVYTLGFNSARQNQYCTLQYPNYNCPPQPYQQQYQGYQYQNTCYRYDGYQNLPVPCTDSDGYGYNNYNDNYNYGYNYNSNNLVTITADPTNRVFDLNRSNNTASIQSPLY